MLLHSYLDHHCSRGFLGLRPLLALLLFIIPLFLVIILALHTRASRWLLWAGR
jgi:hypothetical protein